MENLNSTVIILNDNEYLVKHKKVTKRPNYFMVGNGTMSKQRIFGIDLLRELANSSKAAQWLILKIKDGIAYENNYNPVVKVSSKVLTSTEQQYLAKGYKELKEKNIVKRIKNGHYMINPNALIPPDYSSAIEIWESVEG